MASGIHVNDCLICKWDVLMIVEQDKGIQTVFSHCAPHLCLDELESWMSPFDFSTRDWEQLKMKHIEHSENARELPAVHGLYCGVQISSHWHITIFVPCPVLFPNSDFLLGTVRTTALGQSTVWRVYNSSPLHVFKMSVDALPFAEEVSNFWSHDPGSRTSCRHKNENLKAGSKLSIWPNGVTYIVEGCPQAELCQNWTRELYC